MADARVAADLGDVKVREVATPPKVCKAPEPIASAASEATSLTIDASIRLG